MNVYAGTVRHRRFTVKGNEFTHKVAYAYLDLDALPVRRGPVSFRREDFLSADAARERAGTTGPVRLLTTPRVLGLIFNPVSFYYCFEGDALRAVLAEVTNTPWGERHTYVAGEDLRKELHVSPLMPMDQRYSFRAPEPGATLSVHIESRGAEGRAFDATLNLRRRPFAVAPLLRGSALRTLPLIYLHALVLRLRGVPGHPHPVAAPASASAAWRPPITAWRRPRILVWQGHTTDPASLPAGAGERHAGDRTHEDRHA